MIEHENFLKDILEFLDGEDVEAVVIGESFMLGEEHEKPVDPPYSVIRNRVISWESAQPYLDYPHDYGCTGGRHAILIWTASRVIFLSQYDCNTSIESVPRHPVDCFPEIPGG